MGCSLSNVICDIDALIEYQSKILNYKCDALDEIMSSNKNSIIITDRTFIDFIAYTTVWMKQHSQYKLATAFLDSYKNTCEKLQHQYEIDVVYFPINVFSHIDDGIRAGSDTQADIDNIILDVLSDLNRKYFTVSANSPEERATQILDYIRMD